MSLTGSEPIVQKEPTPTADVIVVGAGLAGLTAAHRLAGLGLQILVLEAGSRPGGMVRSRRDGEWLAEAGLSQTVPALPSELDQLLISAGVGEEIRLPVDALAARRFVVHEGAAAAVPTTPSEMVSSPLLSVSGRLRLLKEPFIGRGEVDPEESVASFARRRFGSEMAERFIDPAVSASSGGDPEELVARHAMPGMVEFERRSGSVLKGRMRAARRARREGRPSTPRPDWSGISGLEDVTRRMASSLATRLLLGHEVVRVGAADGQWTVDCSNGDSHRCRGVLFATPASELGRISLPCDREGAISGVGGVPHASMAVVSLGFRRDQVEHRLDGYGVSTASTDSSPLRSIFFASSVFSDRAPAGHVLLTARMGGVAHAATVDLTDAELGAELRHRLDPILGVRGREAIRFVDRWPNAVPQAVRGHGVRLAAIEDLMRVEPSLAFCGAWRDGLSLGDALRGGAAAADQLAAGLADESRPEVGSR